MALEEGIDLGFVNYRIHPENKRYYVFRFKHKLRAEHFEMELTKAKIWFEKDFQEVNGSDMVLFGIHKNDFDRVQKINFNTEAKFRQPFIKDKLLRYFILLFTIGAITLGIISYWNR